MKLVNSDQRQKQTSPPSPATEPPNPDSGALPDEIPDEKADREERIRRLAYRRAQTRGFDGDPLEHWIAAEAEIDAEDHAGSKSTSSGGNQETEQARIARSMGNSERK